VPPRSRRVVLCWPDSPPAASGAPRLRAARQFAAELSRDQAVRDYLEEDRPHLRWCISLPVVAPAKMFQVPCLPVLQRLFEAVCGPHQGTGRHRLRLTRSEEENRSVDVALAVVHHARYKSCRLQPRQSLFGHAGVQTTVGLIDGNRDVHVFLDKRGVTQLLREGD